MEERLVRLVTIIVSAVSILAVTTVFYLPNLRVWAEETAASARKSVEITNDMNELEMMDYNTVNQMEGSTEPEFTQQIRIELPKGVSGADIQTSNSYVSQTVTLTIPEADEMYLYDYPMVGSSNHINDLTYESLDGMGVLDITLDEVFELDYSYDEDYAYLDFIAPQEIYDKVIVIDAGHGSTAPGAVKQGIYEKDIDLAIVLELKKLFDADTEHKFGIYYTRTTDCNPTLDQRVQLANKSHANLFISIHNNSTKTGRFSSVNGTAVMYDELQEETALGTKHLAEICLEEVTGALGSTNKGLVYGNEIYIIRTSKVPVALIEVGFMTNQQELANLNTPEYQQKAAQGVYNAILRAIEEGY